MAKVTVYNLEGKESGDITLDDAVFGVDVRPEVVQSVARIQQANAFVPYAHTKTRGEVRGGGKKPWKQKGTGRARHGSSRSPIWVGGGITFGPRKEKNTNKKVNKKTKQQAVRMVLSDKVAEQKLIVVDSFSDVSGKTKQIATLLNSVAEGRPALFASAEKNIALTQAAANIQRTNTVLANSLNVVDMLKHQYLVLDKAAVEQLVAQYK